ncbi:S-adenosyl-L-methionine-dependent methyltransferase [Geopyxis carbonaria]|nr:S-adenosyl-L-methionine-dependent methyltransferase [Geopyxis carbonaria]
MEVDEGFFVGVSKIIERCWADSKREILIQGPKFVRSKQYQGLLPKKINEVAMDITTGKFIEVSLEKGIKPRLIILTNAEYPKFRDMPDNKPTDYIYQNCRMVCRWRIIMDRYSGTIERLRQEDAHKAYRVEDSESKTIWRETAIQQGKNTEELTLAPLDSNSSDMSGQIRENNTGNSTICSDSGMWISEKRPSPEVELMTAPQGKRICVEQILISDVSDEIENVQKSKYTFGDAFCGGGGASCGARAAGLTNRWAFDRDDTALKTYQSNFTSTEVYKASVDQFLKLDPSDKQVDVLHLSPPCQPHSPAHTITGRDDEVNEASGLCIKPALEFARPRVATLEQTFGILNPARLKWFRAMINDFVLVGYSVRWCRLDCVEYGVPQLRRRLIVVASCPGEVLPKLPAPTYSNPLKKECSNLRRPRTVGDAIRSMPFGVADHCPQDKVFQDNQFRFPYCKWDEPFGRTILAGGGNYDVHPNGLRRFTVREIASLQAFPISYCFHGTESQKKRQIGNAVPPRLAEAVFREIRKSLEEADQKKGNAYSCWSVYRRLIRNLAVDISEDQAASRARRSTSSNRSTPFQPTVIVIDP